MGSTLADKVLKKTHLDLHKRFPDTTCVSQILGGLLSAARHSQRTAQHSVKDLDEVGKTLVDG